MTCESGFESTFRGNIDGAYRATNADELSAIFDTLANTFTEDVQTDADSSHSIKVLDSNNELKEYSIEDVYSIVLSLQEDKDSSSSSIVELKFEEGGTGVGGIYDLNEIYDKETGIISLEKAWQLWEGWTGLNPSDLDSYEYKAITVFTN
ncbi:MAG: hypothetical protein J6K45_07990 [Clostridia bacterium]|nr:hypothetical protein [Clostridia bacterium]